MKSLAFSMRVPSSPPDWKLYERLAAFVEAMSSDPTLSVHPNVKLVGQFSGVERPIDVLIDCRLNEDRSKRVILDAKLRARPLDVKDVEEFEGMMMDVRADRGILVCPNGFSSAAERRARRAITIKLLDPAELTEEHEDVGLDLNAILANIKLVRGHD